MELIAEHLGRCGHDVTYVTQRKHRTFLLPKRYRYGAVEVVVAPSIGLSIRGIGRINALLHSLMSRLISRYRNPEIAYCYYEPPVIKALLAVRRQTGMPVVMRMAGMHWFEVCKRDPRKRPLYGRLFSEVDSVNYIHSELVEMTHQAIDELQLEVEFRRSFCLDIGVGIPPEREPTLRPTDGANFEIMMASRFSDYAKRQDLLIEAMSLLESESRVRLHLVGEGPLRSTFERSVQDLGIADRVRFHNFMDRDRLWSFMERCDLVCHAAEYEGLGKIVVEALWLGCPLLVSDVRPLNTLISHGETGLLVENTPESWAEQIQHLAREPDRLERLAQNGVAYAREHYDPQNNIQRYIAEFRELLAECG